MSSSHAVPDAMLEDIARHLYERLSAPNSNFPEHYANGYARRVRERYMNAAASVLLLADEWWQRLEQKP